MIFGIIIIKVCSSSHKNIPVIIRLATDYFNSTPRFKYRKKLQVVITTFEFFIFVYRRVGIYTFIFEIIL